MQWNGIMKPRKAFWNALHDLSKPHAWPLNGKTQAAGQMNTEALLHSLPDITSVDIDFQTLIFQCILSGLLQLDFLFAALNHLQRPVVTPMVNLHIYFYA